MGGRGGGGSAGTLPRLSLATLGALPDAVARPRYAVGSVRIGVVHLGVGNFHRAHQAVAFERLLGGGDLRWGIAGVSLRRSAMRDALAPQDGLYTVLERGPQGPRATVVGALRELHAAADGLAPVIARIADPQVAVVTLTITEKGYDDTGPASAAGLLAAALAQRRAVGAGGLTAISCDNLQENGAKLRERVLREAAAVAAGGGGGALGSGGGGGSGSGGLVAWIERSVAFPNGMVDRIVPATTQADRDDAAALLGCIDEWPVPAEPFSQWVLEDRFAGPRPALETAGVQMVDDVAGWEAMKLRLLNAAHSAFAYLGAAAGLETVDQAAGDPRLRAFVERLWDEAAATLPPAVRPLVAGYTAQLHDRWANPGIRHRLHQIAMDGSRKLPNRLIAPLREQRRDGRPADAMVHLTAAWMHWAGGVDDDGSPHELDDPLAERLASAASAGDARATVRAMLQIDEVFGTDLRDDAALVDALSGALAAIRAKGTLATLPAPAA
jgi:fructuronate reductase